MRLAVLIAGVLLMGGAAFFDLWPLVLIAAILTALVLIRFYEFYRSIPFLLSLLGFLSFFLAVSTIPRSSPFDILRGTSFAVISLAITLISALACAEVLIVCRGGNRRAAFIMMLGLLVAPVFPTTNPLKVIFARLTKSLRALQIVQGDKLVYSMPESEDFRMPGPGILIIRAGSAAVLEQSGRITRIVGPGFYLTEPFEHLSAIVDLSLQCRHCELEDVLTKDSIPLKVELTVHYRIMIDQPALITKAEYRLDQDAIRRAVLTTADWNEQTEIVAKGILRDTIATRFLDEIYDPRSLNFSSGATPRVPLQHELRRKLSQESQRWGVEIVRVTLDKITLPEQVRHRMIQAWDVTWHDVVEMARALTEAKALTARALGAGQAARVEAINEARARLEAVGINSLFKLLEAKGEAVAELEAAKVKTQQTVIEAQARADTQTIEVIGKATGELGSAEIGSKIAEFEAQRRVIKARGEADAQMIEGRAKAVAEAERFREVLLSLQRDFAVDEKTLAAVIIRLVGVFTDVTDLQALVRFLTGSRSLVAGPVPAQIEGGDGASPGPG